MRALILAVAVALAAAQTKTLTIEQLMGSPFPSELVASPEGSHLAWVQNAAGVRNLWMASPPDYVAKAITAYKADDGQEIAQLTWTPDSGAILYVRGGPPNRGGEIPNPGSDPAGTEQAIWVVSTAGNDPKKLGEGTAPAVSPKGGRVAYIKGGQAWWTALDGSSKPEILFRARGTSGSLRWSPDGSQLAFVSNRGDHGLVGVYDVAARRLRFLDPSLDRDSNPVWSPDGKQIAFLREPSMRDLTSFRERRAGFPWSIRVADAATFASKLVFQADPGRGSVFHAVSADNQILWASTGHLVFPWERDGWTHLYSVPATGGTAPKLLTFGEFEVEDVSLTPDGKEVLYCSNADDIDRRHISRVGAAGGPVSVVTSGKGIEWSPAMTSDGKAIAFLRSDARMPARAAVLAAFGQPRDMAPFDFPAEALVEPQPVIYSASDGMKIHAQLFLPAGASATDKRPAVVFFHGGSRRQMLVGWHYRNYYHNAYAINQYLTSKGYVVLAVNYRSGIGYGLEFREALNYGAGGASEFHDVMGAGLYLQSRPDVDPKRIGLWGGSYGGYLTALGLARASELFAAGVDLHGVHDWNVVLRNFNPSYNPQAAAEAARLAFESSPMASVKTWKSPVLLIHGDDDRNVPFSESVTLAAALRAQGVEFEQLVFPDEVHDFLRHARWLEAYRAAADFFDRKLKGKK